MQITHELGGEREPYRYETRSETNLIKSIIRIYKIPIKFALCVRTQTHGWLVGSKVNLK